MSRLSSRSSMSRLEWGLVTFIKELPSRSYPDGGNEPTISSIGYKLIGMEVIFVKKLFDGSYPNGGNEPAISSMGHEPTRMGVTFVKELSCRSTQIGATSRSSLSGMSRSE